MLARPARKKKSVFKQVLKAPSSSHRKTNPKPSSCVQPSKLVRTCLGEISIQLLIKKVGAAARES